MTTIRFYRARIVRGTLIRWIIQRVVLHLSLSALNQVHAIWIDALQDRQDVSARLDVQLLLTSAYVALQQLED